MTNANTKPSYTLLRVKRKRNEDPVDALVFPTSAVSNVNQRVKKRQIKDPRQNPKLECTSSSLTSVKVFKFAKTVPVGDYKLDPAELLSTSVAPNNVLSTQHQLDMPTVSSPTLSHRSYPKLSSSVSSSHHKRKTYLARSKARETKKERYKVIGKVRGLEIDNGSIGDTPGKCIEMFDAIREEGNKKKSTRPSMISNSTFSSKSVPNENQPLISEKYDLLEEVEIPNNQVDILFNMVHEYLNVSAPTSPHSSATPTSTCHALTPSDHPQVLSSSDDDYVYDIYIQSSTSATSPSDAESLDVFESQYNKNQEASYWQNTWGLGIHGKNIDELTNDQEFLLLHDSFSSDDEGANWSDDSNAEDWYGNDYPDEDSNYSDYEERFNWEQQGPEFDDVDGGGDGNDEFYRGWRSADAYASDDSGGHW